MKRRYDSVFFDLDGTLTDSGPGIMRCAAQALKDLGLPCEDYRRLRTFVGPPLRVTFPKFGVPEDRVEEAIRIYRVHYHQGNGKFENAPYEGIQDLLDSLLREGYDLYVATSKPEALSIEIMDRFDLSKYFRIICGASQDASRENKDAVIRYLLSRVKAPGRTVMVGDTVYDVLGAAALSLPCIGVSWGYGDVPSMLEAGAVGIADTMEQLHQMLATGPEPASPVS